MFLYVPLILHFKCHESSILNIKSHGTYKNAAVPTTEPTTVPTVHTAVPTTNGSGGRILRETPWRILLMPRRLVLRSLFFSKQTATRGSRVPHRLPNPKHPHSYFCRLCDRLSTQHTSKNISRRALRSSSKKTPS